MADTQELNDVLEQGPPLIGRAVRIGQALKVFTEYARRETHQPDLSISGESIRQACHRYRDRVQATLGEWLASGRPVSDADLAAVLQAGPRELRCAWLMESVSRDGTPPRPMSYLIDAAPSNLQRPIIQLPLPGTTGHAGRIAGSRQPDEFREQQRRRVRKVGVPGPAPVPAEPAKPTRATKSATKGVAKSATKPRGKRPATPAAEQALA